ncbi:hypothetical protein [Hyalangium rubrum]|uniref:Vegetative protein n=1 Tax=Hyalangium rubrum TaxID=3103134 RepID=A0ABU5GWZ6_9BACT|nr:hypothetical protein [Hyalangium sp. s54d21]MDY7225224.1 hypothetical protein [Hyalangium sp. s54d21]
MARPRKSPVSSPALALPPALASWAEAIGDAIGRGLARALHNSGLGATGGNLAAPMRKRGRPPKVFMGPVPPERRCTVPGCERESRSKGLCSAHYQAERRRNLAANNKPKPS